MEKHQVQFGEKFIEFELERKNVKNVNLNIKPNMEVVVTANERVPLDFIYNFVKSKGPWILKHLSEFSQVQPIVRNQREYVSGESLKYLGRQYRLRVEETDAQEIVKYFRGFIYLYVNDKQNHSKKVKMMDTWYKEKARKTFEEINQKLYQLIQKYDIAKPNIEIRTMKARWGSALIDSNIILLNTDLIKAPKHCIEYVILHEMIHFKYNNHNENFYNMLTTLMPDWKKRKAILDEEIVREL